MTTHPYIEVESIHELPCPNAETGRIEHYAFQNIDFNSVPQYVAAHHRFSDCCFLGCDITKEMEDHIGQTCLIFPKMRMLYRAFTNCLYTGETLYEGYDPDDEQSFDTCYDTRVYQDYIHKGKHSDDIRETLARTIHDHSMSDAMYGMLNKLDEKQIVAVMGGHALLRTDQAYRKVALLSKALTEKGKLMVSGGGPGAMEATHFGAWMAGRTQEEVDEAIAVLSSAPGFHDEGWLHTALQIVRDYPQKHYYSLGIPTWLYGHEPATVFATHIAKFFTNSIREDEILSIAGGGIIFTPGSAGTLQEIFQEAVQNHYLSFGHSSPMIFFGKDFWNKDVPIYPLFRNLSKKGRYQNLLISTTDDIIDVVTTLMKYRNE